jgi:hypothetical protein
MNIDCRVIGDLLPLYADESCSDASRALIEEHLKCCPRCRETLARMKSEQFLPAAQVIDPPAVADYAQKVKHRRQKRGTLLTVGVIVLIVLLSLTAAAWMNLVRAQHPYIPVVEESVCNLAAGEVHTFADSCDGRRLFTNSTRIAVTFRADTPQDGTITLWNITDVTTPYPAMSARSTDAPRAANSRIFPPPSAILSAARNFPVPSSFPTVGRRTFGRASSICFTFSLRADSDQTPELTKASHFSTIKAAF